MSSGYTNSGTALELRTAAYFQSHGFLVRRGVVLAVAAESTEATDIDLLAIRFTTPLCEERIVADCKDRKKSRPFERVLWTLGLGTYCRADRSIVVTPRAPSQARDFAAQGRVEVLGVDEMDAALASIGDDYQPFGEADPFLAKTLDAKKRQQLPGDKWLDKESLRLRQMLTYGHPLTNLNRIIRTFALLERRNASPAGEWHSRYVRCDAAVIASVMLTRIAAEWKWMPEKDWTDAALKRLTYGDLAPDKARQLARLALDREFFDGLPAPSYADEVVALLAAMMSQPDAAAVLPLISDHFLLGQSMGGCIGERISWIQPNTYESAMRLAKRMLSTLAYASEVSPLFWEPNVSSTKGQTPIEEKRPDTGYGSEGTSTLGLELPASESERPSNE